MITSGIVMGSAFLAAAYMMDDSHDFFRGNRPVAKPRIQGDLPEHNLPRGINVPSDLMGLVYHERDFVNDAGISPTFWNDNRTFPGFKDDAIFDTKFGPCYGHTIPKVPNWQDEVDKQQTHKAIYHEKLSPMHAKAKHKNSGIVTNDNDLRGYCRPGFIILGAGKCGTSSLYHYLTDHPRVLPASEKQIHYFKYYTRKSMKWYLEHFPTAANFLATGTLMTGEASPGYLPYPDVAHLLPERMPGTRLIVVGRDPIERAYSSFMYSYIDPHVAFLERGSLRGIPGGLSREEYLSTYLFSFEETVRAELKVLKDCLAEPNGKAIVEAKKKYGQLSWFQKGFRENPLLADLDSFCYGGRVSKTILRAQWADLVKEFPKKVILDKNTHLLQSHVGRSIYALPLEWWYTQYDANDIFFVCTEDLKDLSGNGMEPLRQWLGLPVYNFSSILQGGAYNVGGHGEMKYDKEISWSEATKANATGAFAHKEIPLSPELRKELEDFFKPYNERLYKLVGKRCQW